MSKHANPTLIGAFVVGAVSLFIVALLTFTSGELFRTIPTYVLFFQGSVKGLNIGAPVSFRGVKVGSVTDIRVVYVRDQVDMFIPVTITIDDARFQDINPDAQDIKTDDITLQDFIDHGLRAQLQLQSFLTGQLAVQIDYFPDTKVVLVGKKNKLLKKGVEEIPTIPSTAEEITKALEELNLKQSLADIRETLSGVNKLVNDPQLTASMQAFHQTIEDIGKLSRNANKQITPLGPALVQLDTSLKAAENAMKSVRHVYGEDSNMVFALTTALTELAEASRAVRVLASEMERQPSAIFTGKTQSGDKQ